MGNKRKIQNENKCLHRELNQRGDLDQLAIGTGVMLHLKLFQKKSTRRNTM